MKFDLKSIKEYFINNTADEYDDEELYDDEVDNRYDKPAAQQANATTAAAAPTAAAASNAAFRPAKTGGYNTVAQRPNAMRVIIVEPTVFEDSENITNQLRDMRPVVINFEKTDPHEAVLIVDFVIGAIFALYGKLEKSGKDIFICVPVNVTVDYNDKSYTEITDKLAWKEPQL